MLHCFFRKLDDLGRLTLPKELRRKLRMEADDSIVMWIEDDKIILKLGRKKNDEERI